MIPDNLEEPVPCEDCGAWVELQRTKECRGCGICVCRDCLEDGWCTYCRDGELQPVERE